MYLSMPRSIKAPSAIPLRKSCTPISRCSAIQRSCIALQLPKSPSPSARRCQPRTAHASSRVSRTGAVTNPSASITVPDSQGTAVRDAAACVLVQVKVAKDTKAKSKPKVKAGKQVRLAVEIPIADQSPQAVASLATSLLKELKKGELPWKLIYADVATAKSQATVDLQQACKLVSLRESIVVVCPRLEDVALVEQLTTEVHQGASIVLLNADWSPGLPQAYQRTISSFDTAYCFMPLAIQGLLGTKEGALLRALDDPGAADVPWRIFYSSGGQLAQVGQTKTRPSPDDLQLAFMNAAAAESPLTRTVKFFRGLVNKPGQ